MVNEGIQTGRSRSTAISLLGGLTLLLLALTVFAVAAQARSLSTQAEGSVQTVENLRVVSDARSEISVASRVAAISSENSEVVQGAIDNANERLDAIEANFDENTSPTVLATFANFRSAVNSQASVLLAADQNPDILRDAETATGRAFSDLIAVLRSEQLASIEGLEGANELMNVIATIATFIVAFVVPSAGLFIFQSLRSAPRQLRSLQFEHDRTTRRSEAMATTVAKEAAALRRRLSDSHAPPTTDELRRQLLRFENMAAVNGASTAQQNEKFDVNAALEKAIGDLDGGLSVQVLPAANPTTVGDAERFDAIVTELVANAITHGVAPYEVKAASVPTGVEIHVSNGGPELPEHVVRGAVLDEQHELRQDAIDGSFGYGLIATRKSLESIGGNLRYDRIEDRTVMIASFPSSLSVATVREATRAKIEDLAA